ncbi:MAG: addiction module toxin RelE [Defluviitaleaceae bacterium]|nr:addiction module toxin RelE [Defluviitaleaceae bacterium]
MEAKPKTRPKTRRKKMTKAEKAIRADVKKRLQDQGILPPDKKPLNRKKFALEVLPLVKGDKFSFYDNLIYLVRAFSWMLPNINEKGKILFPVTAEQVGLLKVLKITVDYAAFWKAKEAEGITEVKLDEVYKTVIKPILDL